MRLIEIIYECITERLAWCCTMLCLAVIALVRPKWLMAILDDFSKEQSEPSPQQEKP